MSKKLINNKLEKLKEQSDKEADYQGGGAYRAFLKLFYKNIQDKKKQENNKKAFNLGSTNE